MKIVSGIQPSGKLHLGNYLGAIKNWINLQEDKNNSCLFFLADLHSLTESTGLAEEKKGQIEQLAIDLLALGLDPKKCTLFIQSHVSEATELSWFFNCVTPIGDLERMTQYKDKSKKQPENINAGLFTYPILMAADILLYKAEGVPVGDDQLQHLEIARETARRFNRRFGDVFPEPKALLTRTVRLMSLKNPLEKMSKSSENSYIGVFDEPKIIQDKIKSMATASNDLFAKISLGKDELIIEPSKKGKDDKNFPAMSAAVVNMFNLMREFNPLQYKSLFDGIEVNLERLRYGELKESLAKAIVEYFAPFKTKREELMKDKKAVMRVYEEGAKKAREIAQVTMKEVKEKAGLI
ncbi:MAG TPA: tryptophan--tRNA ligase [Candidatus Paceibacterota bacterium]|nr:tryptophan--tRNA ligase [Candidatus Paceibacterota bacterium]HPT40077.1 tryptophan--tRNA ligase [Candidatus Paceibacterota bacterium]